MLLALKDDKLSRAIPGQYAICPHCEEDVISICGSIRIWHWRHTVGDCIYHTEPETDWHLEWKDRALRLGLEIEKRFGEHIADIYDPKTNIVIEVQHSPISEEDILDRCIYYNQNDIEIKWIFDRTEKENHFHFTDHQFGKPFVNFKEKWNQKSMNCLFDNDNGNPNYDISLHTDYFNDKPLLLKICILDNKNINIYNEYGTGIAYSFCDFNDNYIKRYNNKLQEFEKYQLELKQAEWQKYQENINEQKKAKTIEEQRLEYLIQQQIELSIKEKPERENHLKELDTRTDFKKIITKIKREKIYGPKKLKSKIKDKKSNTPKLENRSVFKMRE